MASINPISGLTPVAGTLSPASTPAERPGAAFADALKTAIDGVDSAQQKSAMSIQDLVTGNAEDTLSAVTAMAKADLSFKLLLGVRNKVIEAYKQTMNMQI
jgi:flagellar hook-basal body complex protein FliE